MAAILRIDTAGAKALLALLSDVRARRALEQPRVDAVLGANRFFFGTYGAWLGNAEELARAAVDFDDAGSFAEGSPAARMAEGFRLAADDAAGMERKLAWIAAVDAGAVERRVAACLPADTPLGARVFVTVDNLNNAFVNDGNMGVSLLKGAEDEQAFLDAVSHELHHIGFRHWAGRNGKADEKTPAAVAAAHVQNLLMEGLANVYLTPAYVFAAAGRPDGAFQAKLRRLAADEADLFRAAEDVLRLCFEPSADYDRCFEAYEGIAMDWKECLLPAGHYLGARMVRTIDALSGKEAAVACVRDPARFLPLYNRCAENAGGFVFDRGIVERLAEVL